MLSVKIINTSPHELPAYATLGAAGMDLRACLPSRALIPTGLYMALPLGYEAQIRPRSGLSMKHGITVINSPGTIDADYRGELRVPLINLSNEPFTIQDGERIAQMVVARHEVVEWQLTTELSDTDRGHGGFGHTGKE